MQTSQNSRGASDLSGNVKGQAGSSYISIPCLHVYSRPASTGWTHAIWQHASGTNPVIPLHL